MRALPLPGVTSSDVMSLCLSGTADAALRSRLKAIGPNLEASAMTYDANALAERLDLMAQVVSVGAVTKEELVALYSTHMSATGGAARAVYDQIRNAAPNKKCPLCGVGTVAVVDHHLPKAKYPDLSVVPANLVPACHFCNDTKKARYPRSAGEQTLHPYYDVRLLGSRWLRASIIPGTPVVITYSAHPPAAWTLIDRQRVQRHFVVCGLGTVFASNANDELGPLKTRLEKLEARGGAAAVQAHLIEETANHSARPNSWQLSMYEALATDAWFTGGGFRAIA
jgi:hypothetical protein